MSDETKSAGTHEVATNGGPSEIAQKGYGIPRRGYSPLGTSQVLPPAPPSTSTGESGSVAPASSPATTSDE